MSRVKGGNKRLQRRKRLLKHTKGNFGARRNLFRTAAETHKRSMAYAFRDRKVRKRDFRRLWTVRINAALKAHDLSYSKFIHGLKLAGVELNRKMLSELAIHDEQTFSAVVHVSKQAREQIAA